MRRNHGMEDPASMDQSQENYTMIHEKLYVTFPVLAWKWGREVMT
jgi:hypothetical protein